MFPHQSGAYLFKQLAAADISVNGLSMLSDFNVFYHAVLSFQLFSYLTDNTRNLLDLPDYIISLNYHDRYDMFVPQFDEYFIFYKMLEYYHNCIKEYIVVIVARKCLRTQGFEVFLFAFTKE